jgi:hypothetical protein
MFKIGFKGMQNRKNCVIFGFDFSLISFGVACIKISCVIQYIYHKHNYIVVVNGFTFGMAKGIEFIYIRFMAQIWVGCTILKSRKKYDCSLIIVHL